MMNEDIRKEWENFVARYKTHFMTYEETWINNMKSVSQHIEKYKKRPTKSNKDPEIKRLASWLLNQPGTYIKRDRIMSREHIRKLWEEFVDKYKDYL